MTTLISRLSNLLQDVITHPHLRRNASYYFSETASVIDSLSGDEVLHLVGRERTVQFGEEYNQRLRRKLDLVIPPLCAAVYFTQFLYVKHTALTGTHPQYDYCRDKTSLNYASIMGLLIMGQIVPLHIALQSGVLGVLCFLVFEFPTVYISQKLRVAKYPENPVPFAFCSATRISWFYVMITQ
ncbi:hypothetical protein BDY19DRAFT_909133 [Irpex rosettiformis]|uniref:Uncharacterized protein n=1 Tax=Irpex rosettiformis TaxID=378272 RepID=A0ACB8TTD0_9APHY|nr:hypothetical protein BDY19DRAFT_909133 [Irpex rosettiformis]